jgi:hypothetical protein
METREHDGFGHGLRSGTTADLNCPSCKREDAEPEPQPERHTGWIVICPDHKLRMSTRPGGHAPQRFAAYSAARYWADWGHCCVDPHRVEPTRLYEAWFPRADWADEFYARVTKAPESWYMLDVLHRPHSRTVTWHGPATREAFMDAAETVGYHGSPPQGPVARLNGHRTPRSY